MEESRASRSTEYSPDDFYGDGDFENLEKAIRLLPTCDGNIGRPFNSHGLYIRDWDRDEGSPKAIAQSLNGHDDQNLEVRGEEDVDEDEERDIDVTIQPSLLQETLDSGFSILSVPLEFDLVEANLDADVLPLYTALSYSWGKTFPDDSHLTNVSCGGKLLRITKTVYQALHRIRETERKRRPESSMLLWLDSICINQEDVKERESQVERMADIYKRCSNMIIWLGEHSDTAVQWLERLNRIATFLNVNSQTPGALSLENQVSMIARLQDWTLSWDEIQRELSYLLYNLCVEIPHVREVQIQLVKFLVRRSGGPESTLHPSEYTDPSTLPTDEHIRYIVKRSIGASSYYDLLTRTWFKRKWVIQEVAQTSGKDRSFLIADKVINFNDLEAELRRYGLLDFVSPLQALPNRGTLLSNLARYRKTLSSDPHDHVYALRGLSTDSGWLPVDYTIGSDELYGMVASYYIRKGNVVAVLALASVKKSSGRLPSWVPDWREESDHDRCLMHTDALDTLAIQGHKLFEIENPDTGNVKIPFSNPQKLNLKAWVVRGCSSGDSHVENICVKCTLLGQEVNSAVPSIAASSTPLSKGKVPVAAPTQAPHQQILLSMRRAQAQTKWAARIREQFEEVIHREEVLCLLEGSPFGFVLWPVGGKRSTGDLSSFTLEYCFQVDEEGWASDWYGSVLGEDRLEWISLV